MRSTRGGNLRTWLATGAVAITVWLFAPSARAEVVRVEVAAEEGPVISRYLYGHFLEHLGRAVYDGVWVGDSPEIPNTNGLRTDVLDALRELQMPVIRWPGGCYADEYHWRSGVGPASERPVTVNMSWGGVEESNAFGTHEFFGFLDALGADAYIAGNLGTGSAREMVEWLEYMTSPTQSTMAELRRSNGRQAPWEVPFFGVGNESWGCGGNMTPAYYADLYKQHATFLRAPGQQLRKVASGGYDAHTEWTERLSRIPSNIDGISHHYYTIPTGVWEKKGNAIGFPEEEWISTLYRALRVENHITAQVAILEENDPDGNIGIYLDEWGTWYDPTPDTSPLYQQNSLRDAFVAALHFHVFHRHAERLHMANIAQTVNVLQAMILTDGAAMVLTPTYHVFRMYIPFQDARYLPVSVESAPDYKLGDYRVPSISATAARGKDGSLYVSVANLDPRRASDVAIGLPGGAESVSAQVLTADEIDSHNTVDDPQSVQPVSFDDLAVSGDEIRLAMPAKSIVMLRVD